MIEALHMHRWSLSLLMLERVSACSFLPWEAARNSLPLLGFPVNLYCSLTMFDCGLTLCITDWSFAALHTGSFLGILLYSSSFSSTSAPLKLEGGGRWGSSFVPVCASNLHWRALTLSKGAQEGVHCFYLKAQLCLWSYFCNTLVLKNHFIRCLILHQSNLKAHWDRGRWCLGLHADFNKPHGLQC